MMMMMMMMMMSTLLLKYSIKPWQFQILQKWGPMLF